MINKIKNKKLFILLGLFFIFLIFPFSVLSARIKFFSEKDKDWGILIDNCGKSDLPDNLKTWCEKYVAEPKLDLNNYVNSQQLDDLSISRDYLETGTYFFRLVGQKYSENQGKKPASNFSKPVKKIDLVNPQSTAERNFWITFTDNSQEKREDINNHIIKSLYELGKRVNSNEREFILADWGVEVIKFWSENKIGIGNKETWGLGFWTNHPQKPDYIKNQYDSLWLQDKKGEFVPRYNHTIPTNILKQDGTYDKEKTIEFRKKHGINWEEDKEGNFIVKDQIPYTGKFKKKLVWSFNELNDNEKSKSYPYVFQSGSEKNSKILYEMEPKFKNLEEFWKEFKNQKNYVVYRFEIYFSEKVEFYNKLEGYRPRCECYRDKNWKWVKNKTEDVYYIDKKYSEIASRINNNTTTTEGNLTFFSLLNQNQNYPLNLRNIEKLEDLISYYKQNKNYFDNDPSVNPFSAEYVEFWIDKSNNQMLNSLKIFTNKLVDSNRSNPFENEKPGDWDDSNKNPSVKINWKILGFVLGGIVALILIMVLILNLKKIIKKKR